MQRSRPAWYSIDDDGVWVGVGGTGLIPSGAAFSRPGVGYMAGRQ